MGGVLAGIGVVHLNKSSSHRTGTAPAWLPPDPATPPGITIQLTGEYYGPKPHGEGFSGATSTSIPAVAVYADEQGFTLYTRISDGANAQSDCGRACAQWSPAHAAATAKPTGGWSIVRAADGGSQWAFHDQPLYKFAGDHAVGDANGVNGGGGQTAVFDPAAEQRLPPGIATVDLPDVGGMALADDRGRTLYIFDGSVPNDSAVDIRSAADVWIPTVAPGVAKCLGAFCVIARRDGNAQWTFKGRPLYRFKGDIEPGYANGKGVDPRFQPALIVRYFMPAEVAIHWTKSAGNVLTTIGGMTLYRRDTFQFQSFGFWSQRGRPPRPKVGRQIGLKGCDSECAKLWHLLKAPKDGQSCGFWNVSTDERGVKYWIYKGYALYTYARDERPGDMRGDGETDFILSEDPEAAAVSITPYLEIEAGGGAGALEWIRAVP
jgi:predicted lipoprotein with Yx(FWY)xxD motif